MPATRQNDLLPGQIRGISRTSLWKSWKAVRKEIKNSSVRDIVDFLDYDVNPDVWINRLLDQIASGNYEPDTPKRFALGKSKGFSRTMTLPKVPDLVLYRTLVDYIYSRSRRRKHKNVYFLRDDLSKAQKAALDEATGRFRGRTVHPSANHPHDEGRAGSGDSQCHAQYQREAHRDGRPVPGGTGGNPAQHLLSIRRLRQRHLSHHSRRAGHSAEKTASPRPACRNRLHSDSGSCDAFPTPLCDTEN